MPSNPMQMMWMGPRGNEQWVKSPDSGGVFTPIGWSSEQGPYINGGTNIRRSKTTHMDYPMSWSIQNRLACSPLRDMYSGACGPGLIYFIDLMAADLNVLPQQWAWPASASYDAIPIIGSIRPSTVPTTTNAFGQPPETAVYQLEGTSRSLYIPIPDGYDAWFGAKGSFSGTANTGLRVTPILPGNTSGTPVFPTLIAANNNTLVNTDFSSSAYQGIVIDLVPTPTITNGFNNPSGRRSLTGYTAVGVGNLGQDAGRDSYLKATGVNTSGAGGVVLQTMTIGSGFLQPLTTYTMSAWVDPDPGSGPAISYLAKIQVSGSGLATSVQASSSVVSAYSRVSVTFTTLASGSVQFAVLNTGASMASGNVVAFRDAQVEIGSTMNNYGDGSYPFWTWAGAADNSISTGVTPDNISLTSMNVQILPTGNTPTPGNFIGGWGHSGCEFDGAPVITAQSSAMDFVGATAHLVEVGDWR